jgi:hypothetical protein
LLFWLAASRIYANKFVINATTSIKSPLLNWKTHIHSKQCIKYAPIMGMQGQEEPLARMPWAKMQTVK